MIEKPSRRGLLFGFAGLLAAPAIVRASSLMQVKAFIDTPKPRLVKITGVGPEVVEVHGYDQYGNSVVELIPIRFGSGLGAQKFRTITSVGTAS